MFQGPLCPNLSQKVQKEVSQMANRKLSSAMLYRWFKCKLKPPKKVGGDLGTVMIGRPIFQSNEWWKFRKWNGIIGTNQIIACKFLFGQGLRQEFGQV